MAHAMICPFGVCHSFRGWKKLDLCCTRTRGIIRDSLGADNGIPQKDVLRVDRLIGVTNGILTNSRAPIPRDDGA